MILNEKSTTNNKLDKIFSLYNYLYDFDYGKFEGPRNYKTRSAKDFEKVRNGVCWDFANYIEWYCNKNNISVQLYYYVLEKAPDYPNHTFPIVLIDNEYYMIETSWIKHRGIYKGSKDNLLSMVYNWMVEEERPTKKEILWTYKYSSNNKLINMDGLTFTTWMMNNAEEIIVDKRKPTNIDQIALKEECHNINESKYQTVYHISDINMGKEVILKPSIPDNYFTKNGYEDAKTKRVCFSTSIDGCLRAMSKNLAGKNLYVYSPVTDIKLYKPKVLKVPDAHVTGELWSTCDTKVKLIGEIHVDKAKDDPIIYHYGIMSAALYDWEWKWVNKVKESTDIFMEASDEDLNPTWNPVDVKEVLDRTDPKKIYLTSDWHLFKNRFKKEHNYVNTQKIITWCRKNIKDDDVFMYLGDISYRWANEECQKESQKIMASIPGIKILILGNHDEMLGQEYYSGCGFDYVYEELKWHDIIFTHKPVAMEAYPGKLNIHGHIHNMRTYNTTDGKANINVYPLYYNNKPVTLDYIMNHQEELMKHNVRSDWVGMGESAIIQETKRSKLPSSAFGIPEDRKYPLDTEEHVRSAIKLFGHAEESKKKSLAKRIKSAANSYNIEIPETTQVAKYLKEWAMASCNPIVGISKPFILKVGGECNGTINTKQFLLSPDIISDKYFAVNENGKMEVIDSNEVDDLYVEEYEYVGDPYRLNYIESAYRNESVVDPTFFYTALSGKDMLSEDQIDFDPVFKKIDFGLIREKNLSNRATLEQEYHDILGDELSINESSIESIAVKPNKRYKNLVVREDANGYYIYNNLSHKRTVSVSDSYMITETMYKSVL